MSFAGVIKNVSLTCAPEANIGDYVLVHVGVAISIVDQKDAEETYEYLRQMGELDGLEPGEPGGGQPMKYVDEYRDADDSAETGRRHSRVHHQAMDNHGDLRRPDPCDC